VSQLQARQEKRERYLRCHQIQYTDKALEWALLSWPDRPTEVRRAGESQSAKKKAKYEAELEVVQGRYPAL
jgi:hypothetical protein